jgi:drug/metabolite transporter (DMT)-like permease
VTGALIALAAGMSLGLFQLFNRKASTYGIGLEQTTLTLLVVSTAIFAVVALATHPRSVFGEIPAAAYGFFALAGVIHFVAGWSFLSVSQRRVGAGRTGSLIGTVPVFSAVLGAVFLGEFLDYVEILGIGCVVAGVILVSSSR